MESPKRERPFLYSISLPPRRAKREKYLSEQFTGRVEKNQKRSKGQKSAQREQVDKFLPQPIGGEDDCDTQFMIVPPPLPVPPPTSNEYTYISECVYIPGCGMKRPTRHTDRQADPFISLRATQ